jgi:PAS domain S-box-containing protein
MERLPENKSYLVYLSHENKEFETKLKNTILDNLRNVEVKTFSSREQIPKDNELMSADLIIIDLIFKDERLEKLHNALIEVNHKTSTPYLLFTNHNDFDLNRITFIKDYPESIFEFVNELTFNEFIFINRIKVLLKIPRISRFTISEVEKIQNGVWKLLDYSNMLVVMIDKNLKVKIINYHLSKILGYEDSSELIGRDWRDFLRKPDHELIEHVYSEIIQGNQNYKEFTNDIIDINKKQLTVKWFNTLINHDFNCVFSVGLPLTKEPTLDEDIDSLRAYFRDILEKDRTVINAMKEVTMKYSEKIFGEEIQRQKNKKGEC